MKVAFKRETIKKGMVFKKENYRLTYSVELTPEERRLVDGTELGKKVLYEAPYLADRNMPITIGHACRGGVPYETPNIDESLAHEKQLKEAFSELGKILRAGAKGTNSEEVIEY
jgi:hypothetical protein